jgi:hypothetical protein
MSSPKTIARRATFPIALMVLAAACASTPTGPSVLILPADGKSAEQFRAEEARCRQSATAQMQATAQGTVPAQGRYDMAYMQCMYAEGNQIPMPGRGWRSRATDAPAAAIPPGVPPPPAGAPPPPPSAAPAPGR